MATSRRVGNYSTSAKAVVRASDQIFDAAMSGKPDFTNISKTAIAARSMERRAVTEAEGKVASAGLEAFTKAKRTQNAADTAKEINDIKRPARRMAGVVAGLGAISSAALMHKNLKEDRAERAAFKAEQEAINSKTTQMFEEAQASRTAILEQLRSGLKSTGSSVSENTDTSGGGTEPASSNNSGGTTPPSSSSSSSVSTNISAQQSFDPTKKMTKAQIKALAESVGFSPEAAGIVVGIAGGESGYDPTNSTQRAIPGRKNLFQQTGEDSVGLMQINWGYHKDSGWLQKLGITKREDLFDPVKNMKAAKYLHDGRKGFGDWTVYNKGIYKDYL